MEKVLVLLLLGLGVISAQVVVDTVYGQVQGQTIPIHTGVNVNSFWAIPFASPPVGDLRFALPEEPAPWDSVFIADSLGPACPQGGALLWYTHPGWRDYSEDCLHLNIFTPEDMSGSYPVLVWFHGGAYTGGANIQYPGHFLAALDVVVVVVNYRLGNLGFLSADGENYKGNWGLHDQLQSLRFVQENIANFGGDPNRVTISGQSAGASSTGLHLVSPLSQGYFSQAICESGSEFAFWAVNWPEQDPNEYGRQVAEAVNCTTEDADEMIECLRQVPYEDIEEVSITCKEGYFCQGMAPVIDGQGGFLPDHPNTLRDAGEYADVPLIQGQTTEDGSWYTAAMIPESMEGGFNRSEFQYYLRELLEIWEAQVDDQTFEDLYAAFDWFYTPWPHIEDEELNREAFNILITDGAFGYSGDKQVKYQQNTQELVWHYLMGFRSPNASAVIPEWMGVPHMGELPYVWGYPLLKLNDAVRDDCLIYFDIIDWTLEEDVPYAEFVLPAWANFVKTGNPNTPDQLQPPFDNPQADWPVYNNETYEYYYMADIVEQRAEYRQLNFAFFREYVGYIIDKEMLLRSGTDGMPSNLIADFMKDHVTQYWLEEMPDVDFNKVHTEYYQ